MIKFGASQTFNKKERHVVMFTNLQIKTSKGNMEGRLNTIKTTNFLKCISFEINESRSLRQIIFGTDYMPEN